MHTIRSPCHALPAKAGPRKVRRGPRISSQGCVRTRSHRSLLSNKTSKLSSRCRLCLPCRRSARGYASIFRASQSRYFRCNFMVSTTKMILHRPLPSFKHFYCLAEDESRHWDQPSKHVHSPSPFLSCPIADKVRLQLRLQASRPP